MIDGYFIQALHESWRYVKDDRAAFVGLFALMSDLDTGLAGKVWDFIAAQPSGLSIEEAYIHGRTPFPCVAVSIPRTTSVFEPLGNATPGVIYTSIRQPVNLTLHAPPGTSIMTVMTPVLMNMVLSQKAWLQSMGVGDLNWEFMSDLSPLEGVHPHKTQVLRRQLTFNTMFEFNMPLMATLASGPDKISVNHYDSVDGFGNPGRVTTTEG